MDRLILLSFDVEEFDVPEEYGQPLDERTKFKVSAEGLDHVLELLDRLNIRATFFTTAYFAIHHPSKLLEIAKKHEVASHGFYHASFCVEDLARSKKALEEILNQEVAGFRMARLQPVEDHEIQRAGYQYNSSMNPTYLPGRYNNFSKPRLPYHSGKLLNIPVSVTPVIRCPLFWLSFKNLPLPLYKLASRLTLNCDAYLNLYFHPWEFTNIRGYQLPGYIKKRSGQPMLDRLENYLKWMQPFGTFATFSEFQQSLDPRNLFR
ncbi:MAG: polysaccharide deacetylase family protein [Leptolyngbya sp. Prado105]|jgi:peptidoglycan/xylan/chitin deacetylase (PgdA/CDA1 family)|nr:polysaccharide deacetylase family protein [Leptolyngbya sp. Prado105]